MVAPQNDAPHTVMPDGQSDDTPTTSSVVPVTLDDGNPSPASTAQQGSIVQHDGGEATADGFPSLALDALVTQANPAGFEGSTRIERMDADGGLGSRASRKPERERAIVEGRKVVNDVFLGCDTDAGCSRLRASLLHTYDTDKVAFARLASALFLPRPMPPMDERGPASAPIVGTVHVNQLFALLESARPPLPCTTDRVEGPLGSHGHAPESVEVGSLGDGRLPDGSTNYDKSGCFSNDVVPRETGTPANPGESSRIRGFEGSNVASKISGVPGRWVTLPGVARAVDMGQRGGDTGDALVDILGAEQAAYARSEWRTPLGTRGKGEKHDEQVKQVEPTPVDGYVRMDDVEVIDPKEM